MVSGENRSICCASRMRESRKIEGAMLLNTTMSIGASMWQTATAVRLLPLRGLRAWR